MTDTAPPRHLAIAPPPDDDGPPAPPSDIAAERAVLGAMLTTRAAIDTVADLVTGPEFYRPAHELIYDAILHLHLSGEPADPITVADELTRTKDITRAVRELEVAASLSKSVVQRTMAEHSLELAQLYYDLDVEG